MIFEVRMKTLFFSFVFFVSIAVLNAADILADSFIQRVLMGEPHSQQKPDEKEKHGLEHAESSPVIASEAEALEGPEKDPQEALRNKSPILASADVPNPAKEELKRREAIEDLKYGTMHDEKNPLKDESLHHIDLDLGLLNPNPATTTVRNAAPAA